MSFLLVFFTCLVTTTSAQTACGETSYYGPTGVISSPNYPFPYNRNLDCSYYVHASEGSSISFIFKVFDVELNYDLVTINCPANASFVPRIHSGPSLMQPVSIPWCSLGLVHFISDESTVHTGFILNYYVSEGGCGNTVFNESHGYVTTPNWQNDYGNNHSCFNIIWTPQRSTIYIDFLEFVLHSCCNCDFLEISCLDNSEYGPYRYCGTYTYDSLTINQCRQTLLWFRSDTAYINKGFNIEYNIVLDGGTSNASSTTPLPPTTPFPPGSCGNANYNGPSGTITSPNYPGNYFDSLKCQYNIIASAESSIALIFEHFDTQEGRDYLEISCEANSNITAQRFSGDTLPQPTTIPSCSQGSLYFSTDSMEVRSGFSIDYFVSVGGCGNTVYTEPIGNVISPNYPSEYGINHDCYNVILAPQRSHFHLQYLDFAVQGSDPCSLDWVEVSCLDNNPSNKHRFCGSTVYSLDVYQCSQVLVWFHSDGATNYPGFNLEYNVYPDTGCGEASYYGPSGNISSPNFPDFYNNSLVCDYDIYTESSDGSIAIIFNEFNTELCCDFVTVSCPTNSSYIPVTYSGHSVPPPVSIPWCSQGRVNFGSDISIASPGFSLDYHISHGGCGNTVYNESHGYVASPNYPSNYNNNQNCRNIIWAPNPASFVISFLDMRSEECCDFVELSCLDNPEYGTHAFSGGTIPPTQNIPRCTEVLVWFHSDTSATISGFNLEYNATQDPDTTILPATSTPPPTTSSPPVTAGTTTAFVPQNCGNTSFHGPSGVISSPDFPGNYSNYQLCNYYVDTSSPTSSIAVIFQAFDTEQCCDYVTIGCPSNSFYPSVKYSGSSLPQPLSIPWCSQAAVNFTSDSSTVSTGFSLDYYVSLGGCGDTVYTGSHGLVSSPNYPNSYDSNQNCSNIIWARLRSSFSITFLYMNVEECCDFVELSCLDNAGFGSHRFTGTSIPEKLDIPECTQVLVWFYADDTIVQTGFNLEYFIAPDSDDPSQRKVPNYGTPNAKERKHGEE